MSRLGGGLSLGWVSLLAGGGFGDHCGCWGDYFGLVETEWSLMKRIKRFMVSEKIFGRLGGYATGD